MSSSCFPTDLIVSTQTMACKARSISTRSPTSNFSVDEALSSAKRWRPRSSTSPTWDRSESDLVRVSWILARTIPGTSENGNMKNMISRSLKLVTMMFLKLLVVSHQVLQMPRKWKSRDLNVNVSCDLTKSTH